MSIEVLRPGLLTSVQDLGRFGQQHLGVPVNGAMDTLSLRLGNLLVGNEETESALELTINGPELRFRSDAVIAICGADFQPRIDGAPVPAWRPVRVPSGSIVEFGHAMQGSRGYVTVAGGLGIARTMGSASTALRGGYGGFKGRALRKGDVVPLRSPAEAQTVRWVRLLSRSRRGVSYPNWSVSRFAFLSPEAPQTLRVLAGRHWQSFPITTREQLVNSEYTVTNDSDRMGFRLAGPALPARKGTEVISEAVVTGAVQIPHGGQPIVLMTDRQTTGGYPVIAVVAQVDLPLLAQLGPKDVLRFKLISAKESYSALFAFEREMRKVREALSAQLR